MEDSNSESDAETSGELVSIEEAFLQVGQSMTEKQKLSVLGKMIEAQKRGENASEMDFS